MESHDVIIRDAVKTYGDFRAVAGISLDIRKGEFFTLLGPSGCGKTTLLRMIAGFNTIDEGTISFGGRVINDVPAHRRGIGMVFQNYAIFPHLTVADNVAYGLKARKVPARDIAPRVQKALEMVQIDQLAGRRPNELSGGQQQRVALARAFVIEPSVLLMDEPLSNLDAKLRVAMRTEITKLHQRLQTTFIYVTHDQTEAMTMGSRICIMKDGFIQQVDTPQNNYDYPNNKFVAGFIGSPQMNFFDVKLEKEGDKVVAVFGDNKIVVPEEKLRKFNDEDHLGKEVVMGIRPENIDDNPEAVAAHPESAFSVNVEVTELMGSETYLYLKTSGKEDNVVARVDPRTKTHIGDNIQVVMDTSRLHFFDKDTEETLLNR